MKQSFFMERIAPPSLVRCEYGSLCSSDRGRSRVAPPPAGSQARPDRAGRRKTIQPGLISGGEFIVFRRAEGLSCCSQKSKSKIPDE